MLSQRCVTSLQQHVCVYAMWVDVIIAFSISSTRMWQPAPLYGIVEGRVTMNTVKLKVVYDNHYYKGTLVAPVSDTL